MDLAGKPLLARTLQVFEDCPLVDGYILVVGSGEEANCRGLATRESFRKLLSVVTGGAERQDSVYYGLSALPSGTSQVVIHDGARPLLTEEDLVKVIEASYRCGAATLAVPVKDTVKMADTDGWVKETLARELLWLIQTPQVFEYGLIVEAYEKARATGFTATDDASLVEAVGERVKLVKGSYSNIKITTPEDLLFAELLLKRGGIST